MKYTSHMGKCMILGDEVSGRVKFKETKKEHGSCQGQGEGRNIECFMGTEFQSEDCI